jgi:ATP-binding cassette, subfamily B, bacterial MsbA
MKNFARLVHYAWRYRVRFALSVGCAVMVALLFFTELGAVYPLLHILFDSQDPQRWMTEKIAGLEADIAVLEARERAADVVIGVAHEGPEHYNEIDKLYIRLHDELTRAEKALREHERRFSVSVLRDNPAIPGGDEAAVLEKLRLARLVAESRQEEFVRCSKLVKKSDLVAIERRLTSIRKDARDTRKALSRCQVVQPYVNHYLPHDSFTTLVLLIALVMLGVALKGLFTFLQEVLVADVMQKTLFDIRNRFFRRTINLDLASFSDSGSSELMTRFTNDMDSFSQGLNTLMSKLVREPMRFATCLGGALWINWRLTCLTLVLVPISAATTFRVGKVMKRAVRRSLESMSSIYKILQESFQGIKIIKVFATERVERRRFFAETKNLYRKSVRVAMIDALSDPVLEMLTLTTVAIALLAGSYIVLNHTIYLNLGLFRIQLAAQPMAIQDLLTLYTMLAAASDPIRKLANVHSKIQRASAAADRICALMDRSPKVSENKRAPALQRHRELIEFNQVTFSYTAGSPVLREVNLAVRHGETIALVGPNGCGKSTLMNLVPRFWDVEKGAVLIDGHDVRGVELRSLRRQIGMVLQETILFQDTIGNNIAYGDPHASRAAIVAAAERAYAHQFIMELPRGYDTLIGERGHGLSGGQRQRIALARAMLRNPAILILDEATSAVDIQDEVLIRKAIEEFARGRTTLLISHNLSSIQVADRIVLINAGRIEAAGTDSELKRASALYRRLHEIHFHRESA